MPTAEKSDRLLPAEDLLEQYLDNDLNVAGAAAAALDLLQPCAVTAA